MKKIIQSAKTGSFKHLTVKEAVLNGLVATEVWMWFYIGEIIGKLALLAMRFEDQSLTSDLSSYLYVLGPCVTGLLSE